ncbi:hypothetical protein HYPSUDRAFT_210662 [Hypholoma sublateritium FD-334 SS-4]|uniref:RING-type domain-containing protein n=1 Tax=Hypholoma sublateritium (strain FD-334 SS-4) TaxID=945553 RepID=A0A0D2LP06_HYPSF|nr:hypothetical protein HYPSUDRAFT_210662 [Hypholoma sublateritium FD-334 SS-4]
MALTITLNKGKKRAKVELQEEISSLPASSEPPHPTKRAKRAETRPCPVCDEQIPLRLLARHSELESERVEEIILNVGSSEIFYDDYDDEPGPSSRVRRSAVKARKSFATQSPPDSLAQSTKTIQRVKRHRKQRHIKLKELAKDDEETSSRDSWLGRFTGEEITCPVCSTNVRGDQDVLDAHVDACLAHESQRLEDARRQGSEEETWEGGNDGNYVGDIRGAGFVTRIDEEGIDEDIDIDGDDQAIFGVPQFTEGDVFPINVPRQEANDEDGDVDIEDVDEETRAEPTLRHLVAAGKVVKRNVLSGGNEVAKHQMDQVMGVSEIDRLDLAVAAARQRGDKFGLVLALESKLQHLETTTVSSSTSLLCRICLDPYTEPTVSTGCWHTCCRECWLRCLGSTKLCPICKRITGAADLRRVYL